MSDQNELPPEDELNEQLKKRPRSPTLLSLKWLAERLRKVEAIRQGLTNGTYQADSDRVAKAMLNRDK